MVFCIAGAILGSFLCFSNLDLFFSLSSIFIVGAFTASIATLLFIKEEWKSGRNWVTIAGLITAYIIIYFAAMQLIETI